MTLAGVCNTDLELVKGYYPFAGVPGHEFVGRGRRRRRAGVGRAGAWWARSTPSCGACATCRAGRRTHCPARTVLGIKGRHGAMAELPDPADREPARGAGRACADEVGGLHRAAGRRARGAASRSRSAPATASWSIGDGKLGQLVARTLALAGMRPDRRRPPSRASSRCCRASGSRPRAAGGPAAARSRRRRRVHGQSRTASPSPARAVRPRGTIVLKSTYHGEAPLNLSGIVVDEVTLVGSRCGPFAPALALLAGGAARGGGPGRRSGSRWPTASPRSPPPRAPGVLKVLIRP